MVRLLRVLAEFQTVYLRNTSRKRHHGYQTAWSIRSKKRNLPRRNKILGRNSCFCFRLHYFTSNWPRTKILSLY